MAMTKVIITRAEPGHSETVKHVAELGLVPVSAPMLHLRGQDLPMPDLVTYDAFLFTSANGVRFFSERLEADDRARGVTAYCVGPATLEAAQLAEFTNCQHADGDGRDLADLVIRQRAPSDGRLLHIANAAAAGDLAQSLRNSGFSVDFLPLYAAEPARTAQVDIAAILAAPDLAVVLIHSAKAAEAFRALYTLPLASVHRLVAVSQKAAAPLATAGFRHTDIAARPNEPALMDCLSACCTRL